MNVWGYNSPPVVLLAQVIFNAVCLPRLAYQVYKRRQKRKHRRQHPDCPDVCYEKRPRETSAFLEEGDEAAVTLGPSEPGQQHRAAE